MDSQNIIKKYTNYLSKEDIEVLKSEWIINWIGWKGWADFWIILKELVKEFDNYNEEKYTKLINDIEYIAYLHDLEFYKWTVFYEFYIANAKFAMRLYTLIHWTNIYKRLWLALSAFLFTSFFWYKYFVNKWKQV
jgi:hypothetical protein